MTQPFYMPSELWVIQTSNNPGSLDCDEEPLYVDKSVAEAEATRLKEIRYYDREDYVVRRLDEVLEDMIREIEYRT